MRILVVDGSNVAFKSFIVMQQGTGPLTNTFGTKTTVIFGVLRMLSNYTNAYKVDKCIICWDGGSKYRKQVFEHYKANRKIGEKPEWLEVLYDEMKTAREYFTSMGISQVWCRGIEGDDLVGYFAKKYVDKGHYVTIMSDDTDFFQLGQYNIKVYRPIKMEYLTKIEMDERMGYPAKLFPKVTAFTGEESDNIPGLCPLKENNVMQKIGLGPAKAIKFLIKEGKVLSLKEAIDNIPSNTKFYEYAKKNRKNIFKSYKLARIRVKDKYYMDWEQKELRKIYADMQKRFKVSISKINNISKYLQFRSMNLAVILRKIGVEIK